MKKAISIIFFLPLLLMVLFTGCKEDKGDAPVSNDMGAVLKVNSCEGCHTNYEHLKAIHTPDPPVNEDSHGCGGPPPYYEPYDRVYLGGAGFEEYKNSIHGELSCQFCHNGVEGTSDKELAHSGDFLKKPSLEPVEKCGGCHGDIAERAVNSLHAQGWGQKRMVLQRSGQGEATVESIEADFAAMHPDLKQGYTENCMKCHGTCGECHIIRPNAMGGGLKKGHSFVKTPDMRNDCVGCHSSRGGHAYFGEAPGTVPDVHLSKAGYNCMDCHTQNEVHGTGEILDTRYNMPLLPKCENCHGDLSNSNTYHAVHFDTFNCQTCHSQDYNNCGSCHIAGDGARIPSHLKFKIAMNPIPDIKPYKLAVVRQSLSAPDSWSNYGIPELENFSSNPTYKYTTPHNILRWTARTDTSGGKSCMESCHIRKEGDQLINKEYYLFNSDLSDWEIEANKNIVLDGKLPASWEAN